MTETEKIKQTLFQFIQAGLVQKSADGVLECIADEILGIGIGEQGFVTCREDVRTVIETGKKEGDLSSHSIKYGRIDILLHAPTFATLCAEVCVLSENPDTDRVIESRFLQLLTMTKKEEEWKICALHASAPVVTEESVEAYPLKFAEKTLQTLKTKIGEQAYQAEEQFRQAILADTIAFYIINFTQDVFEKCQCKSDLCISVEPGTPYDQISTTKSPDYIYEEDRAAFSEIFSLTGIRSAIQQGKQELSFEYRMKNHDNGYLWVATTVRMIVDSETGEQKGIMYVRNIDRKKREEDALRSRATFDGMTQVYNQASMIQAINNCLQQQTSDHTYNAFIILDVDDFKLVNDAFGHPAGDQVLISCANILKASFAPPAIIGRLGGDEFSVFLPDINDEIPLCQKLTEVLDCIRAIRLDSAPTLSITCSIGAALCSQQSCFHCLYERSDSALYQAKKNGKNRFSMIHHEGQDDGIEIADCSKFTAPDA